MDSSFINTAKRKELCQYPAILTKQEWSIKVLMNLPQLKGRFFFLGTVHNPRWCHLAHSGSQSQSRIWFILSAQQGSHRSIGNHTVLSLI